MEQNIINEEYSSHNNYPEDSNTNESNDDNVFLKIEKNTDKTLKRKIGYLHAFYFKNGEPMILIGPHCMNN